VTNIPAYSTDSVAQTVMAHLLNITQRIGYYAEENRVGRWAASPDFCYWDTPLIELRCKQMGVVGLGRTGMAVFDEHLFHEVLDVFNVRGVVSFSFKDIKDLIGQMGGHGTVGTALRLGRTEDSFIDF
jgi:hypothetical protein